MDAVEGGLYGIVRQWGPRSPQTPFSNLQEFLQPESGSSIPQTPVSVQGTPGNFN